MEKAIAGSNLTLPTQATSSSPCGDSRRTSDIDSWPAPISPIAFRGFVGDFVRQVEPHTEADPSALLVVALAQLGNRIGRGPYFEVGGDQHFTNLFVGLVGKTSRGRKGSATSVVERVLNRPGDSYRNRTLSGLSTGEGLIFQVRDAGGIDPATKRLDPGITDKRLLVKESEFARVLLAAGRQGNTLSPVLREAWDHGQLSLATRNQAISASGAHISLVISITKEELLNRTAKDDIDGGLFNRFLWVLSRQSKALPEGGKLSTVDFSGLQNRWDKIHDQAGHLHQLRLDEEAQDAWGRDHASNSGLYAELTAERSGRFGQVTARAAPITLRIAMIYAVLDGSECIRRSHLDAAVEVWRYAEDSARYIFGSGTGNYAADVILRALVEAGPAGLSRTDISEKLGKNRKAEEVEAALAFLEGQGAIAKIPVVRDGKPGRKPEIWRATLTGRSD